MRLRLSQVLLVASILVAGCQASPSTSPSVPPSAAESGGTAGLPPGCEPLELRDRTGGRLVLDGRWTEVPTADQSAALTWWIFTQGNCIWGAGQVAVVPTRGLSAPHQVQSLNGHIEGDFTIAGEILWLGPAPGAPVSRYSPLRMLIEFGEEGKLLLREDREPGVRGPHCPDPQGYCPDPFVLEKATD